jgi:hypothetical protein
LPNDYIVLHNTTDMRQTMLLPALADAASADFSTEKQHTVTATAAADSSTKQSSVVTAASTADRSNSSSSTESSSMQSPTVAAIEAVVQQQSKLSSALAAMFRLCFHCLIAVDFSAVVAISRDALAVLHVVSDMTHTVAAHVPKVQIHERDSNRFMYDILNVEGAVAAVKIISDNAKSVVHSIAKSVCSGPLQHSSHQLRLEQLNVLLSEFDARQQQPHADTALRAAVFSGRPRSTTAAAMVIILPLDKQRGCRLRVWRGCARDLQYSSEPSIDVHVRYGQAIVMHSLAVHAGAQYTYRVDGYRLHAAFGVVDDGVCEQHFPIDVTYFDAHSVIDAMSAAVV